MNAVRPRIDVLLPFQGAARPFLRFNFSNRLNPRDRRGAETPGPIRADKAAPKSPVPTPLRT
jgi:hypothetical protein